MWQLNNLNEAIIVTCVPAKWLMLYPLKFNETTNKYYASCRSIKRNIIYIISIFFLTMYLLSKAELFEDEHLANSVSKASFWCDLYAGIIIYIIGMVVACTCSKQIAMIMNQFIQIDHLFTVVGTKVNYQKTLILSYIGILGIIAEFIITVLPDILIFTKTNGLYPYIMLLDIPIITTGVLKLQIIVFLFIIIENCTCIERLCKTMSYQMHTERKALVKKIQAMHNIYNMLYKILNQMVWIYGIQIISMIGSAINITINNLYYCYNRRHMGDFVEMFFTIQWVFCQQLEIYTILWFCNTANIVQS